MAEMERYKSVVGPKIEPSILLELLRARADAVTVCSIKELQLLDKGKKKAILNFEEVSIVFKRLKNPDGKPGGLAAITARVDQTAVTSPTSVMGDGVVVGRRAILEDWVIVGEKAGIGEATLVESGVVIGPRTDIRAWVVIGPMVKIGSGVKIDNFARIGAGAELGHGAVVKPSACVLPQEVVMPGGKS